MPHTGNFLVIVIPVTAVAAAVAAYYVFPRKKSRRENSAKEDVKRESVNGALKELDAYEEAQRLLPGNFFLQPSPGSKGQDKVKAAASEDGWLVRAFGKNGAQALVASASSILEVAMSPLDWLSDPAPTSAAAHEEKERERVASSMESRRLAEARQNAHRSLYYAAIKDEAARLKALKKKKKRMWSDPDFERGDAAIFVNSQKKQGQLKDAMAAFALNWLPPQRLCSKGGRAGGLGKEGSKWLWAEEASDPWPQPASPTADEALAQVTWYAATAVAAAVQHTPYMSDQLIDTSYEQQGIYGVSLTGNDGGWMMVYVDAYLPCYRLPSTPSTSHHRMLFGEGEAQVKEIWTAIVEKAVAKGEGSYEAIQGTAGVSVVLERVLGCSSTSIAVAAVQGQPPAKADALFKSIRARVSDASTLVLACSRPSSSSSALDLSLKGVPPAQCFTVIGTEEQGAVRLLKLRRPTGPVTWVGDWSRDSDLWNTREGVAIGSRHEESWNANTFFMSLQDFIATFACVEVCACRLSSSDLRRRALLLSLFNHAPHLLKPGLTSRLLAISAKIKADRVAAELLAEEEKKQKKGKHKLRATR